MEKYVVVSYDGSEWGIEGDFYAEDEDSALRQGINKYQKFKCEDEERGDFKAFIANSKELKEFFDNNKFVNDEERNDI